MCRGYCDCEVCTCAEEGSCEDEEIMDNETTAVAQVLSKNKTLANQPWVNAGIYFGKTLQEAAQVASNVADNNRKMYPQQYDYRVLVGEFTHEVYTPPPVPVTLKLIKL
jgi:hypothetical protein